MVGFFTGSKMEPEVYAAMRTDMLRNPAYEGLAPTFFRRNRDIGALWSYAKSVDPSWEPRRKFLRGQFEPLLSHLERESHQSPPVMPGVYDASAWTGVRSPEQRIKAVQTLLPVAQAAIGSLIKHLEAPNHNGAPPLDETAEALGHLRKLHATLGELLAAADNGELVTPRGEGLVTEAARYARRAAKSLRSDPIPYALSATLLAILTACGFPGLGGYLSGIAMAIRKPDA